MNNLDIRIFDGINHSEESLASMTGPELVHLYNTIASNLEESPVRKFKDLATGVKRTWAILERYQDWFSTDEACGVDKENEEDFDPDFDEPKEEVLEKPKKKAKAGVGGFIRQCLGAGDTPAEIIDQLQHSFPDSKASTRDVAWYKFMLKKEQKSNASE